MSGCNASASMCAKSAKACKQTVHKHLKLLPPSIKMGSPLALYWHAFLVREGATMLAFVLSPFPLPPASPLITTTTASSPPWHHGLPHRSCGRGGPPGAHALAHCVRPGLDGTEGLLRLLGGLRAGKGHRGVGMGVGCGERAVGSGQRTEGRGQWPSGTCGFRDEDRVRGRALAWSLGRGREGSGSAASAGAGVVGRCA